MEIKSVSIIGSGNVASHLAKALYKSSVPIINIVSRNIDHASNLAKQVNATAQTSLLNLLPVDLVIIAVSDSAIKEVSESLKSDSFIVHTSGSTSMEDIKRHKNYGVLYPFQTFSKNIHVDFSSVPVFVESNNQENTILLKGLAEKISENVRVLDSEKRMKLHLSAVFANNFTNHMYAIAKEILDEADLPFDILSHLIEETTTKAINSGNPATVQTGPAVRNNLSILKKHEEILTHKPLWQKIYTFVSNSIMDKRNG